MAKARTIDDVKIAVANHFHIAVEALMANYAKSPHYPKAGITAEEKGKHTTARKIAIYLAQRLDTEFSNAEIAGAFGYKNDKHVTSVSVYFNEIQRALTAAAAKKTTERIDLAADVTQIAHDAEISLT